MQEHGRQSGRPRRSAPCPEPGRARVATSPGATSASPSPAPQRVVDERMPRKGRVRSRLDDSRTGWSGVSPSGAGRECFACISADERGTSSRPAPCVTTDCHVSAAWPRLPHDEHAAGSWHQSSSSTAAPDCPRQAVEDALVATATPRRHGCLWSSASPGRPPVVALARPRRPSARRTRSRVADRPSSLTGVRSRAARALRGPRVHGPGPQTRRGPPCSGPATACVEQLPPERWLGDSSTGGQGRGRTADLPIFSRTLVPTELPGRCPAGPWSVGLGEQTIPEPAGAHENGRPDGPIRLCCAAFRAPIV